MVFGYSIAAITMIMMIIVVVDNMTPAFARIFVV